MYDRFIWKACVNGRTLGGGGTDVGVLEFTPVSQDFLALTRKKKTGAPISCPAHKTPAPTAVHAATKKG